MSISPNFFDASTALGSSERSFDASNDNFRVKSFDRILSNNALHKIDAISFMERMISDAQIKKQSEQIAHKLAEGGFDPYLDSENKVSMVGLMSGAVIGLSQYRNINIIPEVSKRNRQPLLQEFDLFLKENPKVRKYSRYMVVTSGERFCVNEFDERLKLFNEQIGRYIELSKKNSIDVILCAIEFTVDGDRTINLHANLVSSPKRAFGQNGWSKWLHASRSHFNGQMLHDAGRIRDSKEIIKYVCKYNEIANLDAESTVLIAKSLHKKQLVRPLGLFREWRKVVKDAGQKIQFDHGSKQLIRSQVKRRKPEAGSDEAIMEDILATERADEKKRKAAISARYAKYDRQKEKIENQILCKTLPQNQATLLSEPFVVVMNFNGSPLTQNGRDGLEAIEKQREFYFKLLAEKGVDADDLADGSSKLDTLTIIPIQFLSTLQHISHKRRSKLFKLLNLANSASDDDIRLSIKHALDAYYPREFHEWSIGFDDPIALLDRGHRLQDEYLHTTEVSEDMAAAYQDMKSYFDSMSDDIDDDLIPY